MSVIKDNIPCPFCVETARITYEEARLYQLKCQTCGNSVLHYDHSWLAAQEFFESIGPNRAEGVTDDGI